jgi:hypothetical protein
MPWIAPSHQAPVLPLKTWKPHLFSGLALCIGAAAPDLDFILRIDYIWIVSHTFAAQLFFTVPLVMVLHLILTALLIPWVLPLLRGGAPLYLHDLALLRPAASARDWLRIAVSGWVGGMSHVLIDGFTHGNKSGWATAIFPVLRTPLPTPFGPLPLYDFLQLSLTILFAVMALRWFADAARRRLLVQWSGLTPPPVPQATSAVRRGALQYSLLCVALGIAVGLSRRDDTRGPWIDIVAHGGLAFLFYGLVAAAAVDRLRARRRVPSLGLLDANEI